VLDKDKMAEYGIDAMNIMQMVQAANSSTQSGSFVNNDSEYLLTTGQFLSTAEDVENLVVGISKNSPVYLKQVSRIEDGPGSSKNYVSFGYGKTNERYSKNKSEYPAVTISVAKVQGADAMKISSKIIDKTEELKQNLIPEGVHK